MESQRTPPASNREQWLLRSGTELLHVQAEGDPNRPTLLMIHGLFGSVHWFDPLARLLSPWFRVVRTDLAGHGRSTDRREGRSPADHARLLEHVARQLDVQPVATIGHSLGADVAIALAETGFPTGDLVIIGQGPEPSLARPSALDGILGSPVVGPLLWNFVLRDAPRSVVRRYFARGFAFADVFGSSVQPERDARAVSHRTLSTSHRESRKYAASVPLDARVAALVARVLILFGSEDDVFDAHTSLAQYARDPRNVLGLIRGSGHSPMLEDPSSVARHVLEFLGYPDREDGPGSGR